MSTTPAWGGRKIHTLATHVFATHGRVCHLCGRPGADTIDHLIPRSRGGPHALDNLRPAHKTCNSRRQDTPLDEWFHTHPLPDRAPPSRNWYSTKTEPDPHFFSAHTHGKARADLPVSPAKPHPGGRYTPPPTQ